MDRLKTKVPPIKNLTVDNITENVIRINSQGPDPRFTYVLERLVSHIHDFARETRLNTKEWMAGLEFLTAVGQTCTDVRQVHGASSYFHYTCTNAVVRNLYYYPIFLACLCLLTLLTILSHQILPKALSSVLSIPMKLKRCRMATRYPMTRKVSPASFYARLKIPTVHRSKM